VDREGGAEIAGVVEGRGAGVVHSETITLGDPLISGESPEHHEKMVGVIVSGEGAFV
jgi:hypothetical protein